MMLSLSSPIRRYQKHCSTSRLNLPKIISLVSSSLMYCRVSGIGVLVKRATTSCNTNSSSSIDITLNDRMNLDVDELWSYSSLYATLRISSLMAPSRNKNLAQPWTAGFSYICQFLHGEIGSEGTQDSSSKL